MNDPIDALIARARAALQASRHAIAEAEARRALALDPHHPDALIVLAWSLCLQNQHAAAIEAARAAVAEAPESAATWTALAVAFGSAGRPVEAEDASRRGLGIDPGNATLWRELAFACSNNGKVDETFAALDRALALSPRDHALLGDAARLRHRHGDLDGAMRDTRAALELAPNDPGTLARYATLLVPERRFDEALAAAAASVRAAPAGVAGHSALGWVLLARGAPGDLDAARASFQEALRIAPANESAMIGMDSLRGTIRAAAERPPLPADEPAAPPCAHPAVTCLNAYEYVRKYECPDCAGVMMCACDRELGERFLPHQLREGTRLESQARVKVTLGFVDGVCATCRGLPEPAAPKRYGSKIARYYWREIETTIMRRSADGPGASREGRDALKAEVEREFAAADARSPKYEIPGDSKRDPLEAAGVAVRTLPVGTATAKADVERAVRGALEGAGAEVVWSAKPVQTLYAVLMAKVIRDADDEQVRMGYFGSRVASEDGSRPMMASEHPPDHGHTGYFPRRRDAIERQLASLDAEWPTVLDRFDEQVAFARPVVTYLWAADWYDEARAMIPLLPRGEVPRLLRWLVQHYWERRNGWPTFLVRDEKGARWVGVLGAKGKLTEEGRLWVDQRAEVTSLPYELVRGRAG